MLGRAFRAWGRWMVRRKLSRELDGVYVAGTAAAVQALAAGPVLFAANHVCWWDGLVLVALDEVLGAERRVLMKQEQLARYPWFQAFGARPLDVRSSAAARRGLVRFAAWLSRAGRAGWIFPQGEHRPAHRRPLGFRRGVSWLAQRSGATVVPVAIDYRFRDAPGPAAFVVLGDPIEAAQAVETDVVERAVAAGLDRIESQEGFEALVSPVGDPEWGARALTALWRLSC